MGTKVRNRLKLMSKVRAWKLADGVIEIRNLTNAQRQQYGVDWRWAVFGLGGEFLGIGSCLSLEDAQELKWAITTGDDGRITIGLEDDSEEEAR